MKTEIEWVERKFKEPDYTGMFLVCGSYIDENFSIRTGVSFASYHKGTNKWGFATKEQEVSILFWADTPKSPVR